MAQVPASSRGLSTSGGTITGQLAVVENDATGTIPAIKSTVHLGDFNEMLACYTDDGKEHFFVVQGVAYARTLGAGSAAVGDGAATDVVIQADANSGQSVPIVRIRSYGGAAYFSIGSTGLVRANVGISASPITSGALPTVAPVSTTPFQCSTTRDATLVQVVTYNPTAGAAATCKVELSPDNVTYSTLITISYPPGVVFDGTVLPLTLAVPAAWYVKLTTTNATLGTGTYY